jgi:hypothetical protein
MSGEDAKVAARWAMPCRRQRALAGKRDAADCGCARVAGWCVCARSVATHLSSHICPSFFFSRVHSRFALIPRPSDEEISRFTPPAVPDSASPTPM